MRYYRCECGKSEAWSSMGVARCRGCPDCGRTLEEHPDDHRPPSPHDWREEWRIDRTTGERWQVRECNRCHREERVEA